MTWPYELAEIATSPIVIEAVQRIDAIFTIVRDINGMTADAHRAVRQERVAPLIVDIHAWMIGQRARVSGKSLAAKAMDYMLKCWDAFTRFHTQLALERRIQKQLGFGADYQEGVAAFLEKRARLDLARASEPTYARAQLPVSPTDTPSLASWAMYVRAVYGRFAV